MIRKAVAAAALLIGLAGYAEAQDGASPAAPPPSSAHHHHHSEHHKQTPKPVKLCEGCLF
jgi:hypothetical protein